MVELSFRDVGYMGVSADSVWAATNTGLIRIDPDDMRMVTVDDTPGFGMFATKSSVWASDSEQATVTRFDPKSASPGVVAKVYGDPNAISVFGDSLWVAEHHGGAVTRLEEPSGAVVTEIKVGYTGRSGPQGVTATADAVWVGIPNAEAVVRIDPATNKVVATIPVTTSPCGGSRRPRMRSGSRAASTTRRSSGSTRDRTSWSASSRSAGTTGAPSS